jgi:hypothetical protein
MHLTGQADQSGFDVCTTTQLRPNDADVLAFGTEAINIPPHGSLDVTCNFDIPSYAPTFHVLGGMPHMHKLGTTIATVNHRTDSTTIDLGTRAHWDFNTQYWDMFDGDTTLVGPGDTVSTRCAWQNPGNNAVTFGENTENEMCFGFVVYYPKITATQWNWSIPSLLSQCSPTP